VLCPLYVVSLVIRLKSKLFHSFINKNFLFFLDTKEDSDQGKSAIMSSDAEVLKQFWTRVLNDIPLVVRRRASYYLNNVKKFSENQWTVRGSQGVQYIVKLNFKEGRVTCTCPYLTSGKGYCKHIASFSVHELFKLDFPNLKKYFKLIL